MTIPEKISIVREIINAHFGVDISVKSRRREVVKARKFYYQWLKDNTDLSLIAIGRTLPLKQDHSTIIFALEGFSNDIDTLGEVDVEWDNVNVTIENRFELIRQREIAFNAS